MCKYRSDNKECYLEELEDLRNKLSCSICGSNVYAGWDYSSEPDDYYYHIMCSKCMFKDDAGYYECFGTDWCNSLNEALDKWYEINEHPCDFLKDNYGLDCCPNYGSSDCPITMGEHRQCDTSKEYLMEIMHYWR